MGQQTSKDELLHQQVNYCNIEGIKSLRSEGAGLEWMDREGKTPLIVACMNPELYTVAKTLIELGANVNAFRPGRHAGTPLHHAAKRGLEPTVKLLLLHGANPLMMNDDCQTPLDVARVKGYNNVVRAIESHICLFSGWLRELYGPGFLELLAPQLLSRKVWVVVLPSGSRNLKKPFKLELAVYGSNQDAQPRTIVALWKANMEEAKLDKPDPAVIISDNSSKTRIKLGAATENDKQQLQAFCNACKGIPQVVHSTFPFNDEVTPPIVAVPATAPPAPEDADLVMAINASLQNYNEASTSCTNYDQVVAAVSSSQEMDTSVIEEEDVSIVPVSDSGPIQYPSIDASPVDLSSPIIETIKTETELGATASSSCVVCLDAPAEGVCVPCGHMAGCMSCLKEITTKKWGCPVCRAKIDQVIRVYAV